MKTIFSIAILLFFSLSVSGKIHIAAEAGYGNTFIKSGYNASPSAMYGIMVGKKFKMILVDVGVRKWSSNYSAIRPLNNSQVQLFSYDADMSSLSFPVSAGVYLPIGKINLLAKAVLAPTFLTKHSVDPQGNVADIRYDSYTDGYYTAAGCDLGIGFSFTKKVSLDVKYSLLTYLSELRHNPNGPAVAYYQTATNEKPRINAFALQLNLFL